MDVRTQFDFQSVHIKGALNLIPRHFKKYATNLIDKEQPLIFVIKEEEQLAELANITNEMNYEQIEGYILMNEVPTEQLERLETISAEEFLEEDDFILLDVRHPDNITRSAPQMNLVNIPFKDLAHDYTKLDPTKPIYTLCGSGNSATAAAAYLQTKEFNSMVIEGGMKAIQDALD